MLPHAIGLARHFDDHTACPRLARCEAEQSRTTTGHGFATRVEGPAVRLGKGGR